MPRFGSSQTSSPIEVRVNSDYPPYEFADQNGDATGFDVDVVRAAANATKLKVHVAIGKWSVIRTQLENDKIDLLAGMLYSAERAKKAQFSEPYMTVEYAAFTRTGSEPILRTADISHKRVLVEEGSQMNDQLKLSKLGIVLPAKSEPDALIRLSAGEGDVALVPLLEGLVLIHDGKVNGVAAHGEPLFARDLCFAANKGNTGLVARLDTGLAIILKDGKYHEIYNRWFGEVTPEPFPWLKYVIGLAAVLVGALAILAIGSIWVATLRRQVRVRTGELKAELAERERVELELRLKEEMYRNLFENASDMILMTDAGFTITDVNSAAWNFLGYKPEELIGKHIRTIIAAESLADDPIQAVAVLSGQRAMRERTYVRKDGTRVFGEVSLSRNSSDHIQAIARDVTNRKLAEDRLKQINEELESAVEDRTAELEAAYKELESFSYSVSHDLRTPLRAMAGFARIVEQDFADNLPQEAKEYLKRITVNAQNMGELIDELLAYARMGRQELRYSNVSISQLVSEVWSDMESERIEDPIELVIEPVPNVTADRTLLRQLFMNLLSNAIKFTKASPGPKIVVGFDEGKSAYFIKDNGIGFDEQHREKMFEVFERLHSSEVEGTGVGLAIVKRVAERHGGKVWAEGAVGQGATFWITLGSPNPKP